MNEWCIYIDSTYRVEQDLDQRDSLWDGLVNVISYNRNKSSSFMLTGLFFYRTQKGYFLNTFPLKLSLVSKYEISWCILYIRNNAWSNLKGGNYLLQTHMSYSFSQSLWCIHRIVLNVCKVSKHLIQTAPHNGLHANAYNLLKIFSSSLKSEYLCQWTYQCHQNEKSLSHCSQTKYLVMLSI